MQLRVLRVDGGPVRRLTLSGAALTAREALELASTAEEIREDESVRVVVLDSAGPDFCPGPADDLDPLSVDPAGSLAAIRPPLVAFLRGRASSVGLEIALAADIRVAEPDAALSMPDVAAGRVPCWGGTQRLPRVVGRPNALRLLLLGDALGADAARDSGLVHEVGDASRVDEIVAALMRLGPLALEYAKEAVREGAELPMREGLKLEADLGLLLQASADRAEGIEAFLQKRDARFEGR